MPAADRLFPHDVALIGAGPIGLELAIGLKQRNLDYLHLEAAQVGHTFSWWAPGTRFFSSSERIAIPGSPLIIPDGNKATREQYLAYLRGVVQQHKLDIHRHAPVTDLKKIGDTFHLTTTQRSGQPHTHLARNVILATGGTATARRLNIPGEDLPHVTHYFQDPHAYFGQRLLIVGGKNTAAESALRAHHAGARVALSYRGAALPHRSIKYWLLPELQGLIDAGRIKALYHTIPTAITPDAVTLSHSDGRESDHPTDFVLLATGYVADMTLFRAAGVPLHPKTAAPQFNPSTMETPISGLYVAGTAIAGTQERYAVFLENCHTHPRRILAHLDGHPPAPPSTTAASSPPDRADPAVPPDLADCEYAQPET